MRITRHTRCGWLAWACVAAALPTGAFAQVRFSIVEENQTWTMPALGTSEYIAAHALPGATKPVVMAGNFDFFASFPPGPTTPALFGPSGVGCVFAGVLDYNGGTLQWEVGLSPQQSDKLEPLNTAGGSPTSEALDLAVASRPRTYLLGLVDDAFSFQNRNSTTFSLVGGPVAVDQRGFVAWSNSGTFIAANLVDPDMQPSAMAIETGAGFLVTVGQERDGLVPNYLGVDARVHQYTLPLPAAGTALAASASITDTKLDDTRLTEATITTDDTPWVGGTKSGVGFLGGTTDVWIGEADFTGDQILNDFRAGSEADDEIHAMERGEHGEVYVTFTVTGRKVSFGSLTYDLDAAPVTVASGIHSFIGMIKSDGTPGWLTPLALAQLAGSQITPAGLSVDEGGNAYVAAQGSGDWIIEGIAVTITGAGQFTVSGKGRVIDYTETPTLGTATAGAVPDIENRLVLGATGGQSAFSSLEAIATPQDPYFISYDDPNLPGNSIEALYALVTAQGGQVHDELDYLSYGVVGVSAWLTPDQFLTLGGNPVLNVVADPLIIEPDSGFGEVSDPGWGLARIFDPFFVDADDPSASYFYPSALATGDMGASTPKKVRVYVIDKGLEDFEPFVFQDLAGDGGLPIVFDGANALSVDALVHPVEDGENVPDTVSDHPRQVVNLLAAANLGTAQGAAMEIIPTDMYSGASPMMGNSVTFASYVNHAILESLSDAVVRDLSEVLPTMIVIASSGEDPMDQVDIGGALQQAVNQGVPVIISAGNSLDPAQASQFVPAMHGDKDGVITVGATSFNPSPSGSPTLEDLNPLYEHGNIDDSGLIISLFAPGGSVDTGFGSSSGTSFSCALVAGLVANHLTAHPQATPAEVEAALVEMSVYDADRDIHLARSACAFEAWLYRNGLGEVASEPEIDYETDSDLDGDTDIFEFLGSSDPMDSASRARVPVDFALNGSQASLSAWLPDSVVNDSAILGDGCWALPVTLELSETLAGWQTVPPDQILTGPVVNGLRELRFDIDLGPYSDDRCFLRFDFGSPGPP
ncbi:hypothetical protein HAHE_21440 [Haloferula helveola]|uniref:Peptidase S8/S53 domain-containing protein n=1 Tax=Haloferula helveola TaxID=490095 RepID=A0ABM7RKL5_9BACT|nr:hypothetical protein HAHE_21440 [Haloferula helveola]